MIFLSILIFILAMSLPFFKTQITPIFFARIAALAFFYAGALTFNALHIQSIGSGIGIYSGFFQITYFSLFIESFLYVIGGLILLSSSLVKSEIISFKFSGNKGFTNRTYKILPLTGWVSKSKEYSLIALFSTLGGSLLLSSGDLLSMYLSIELQSFGLYILATIYRDSGSATGAGLKYFLLGGLSSCLILLGASLIYSFTGLTNFESIYSLISVISMNNYSLFNLDLGASLTENVNQGLSLGLILIVVGFLFKIAGAPFHNWSPDVYDESPTNITIWLTIMPKISIVIFLLELEMGIVSQLSHPMLNIFTSLTHFEQIATTYADFLQNISSVIPNIPTDGVGPGWPNSPIGPENGRGWSEILYNLSAEGNSMISPLSLKVGQGGPYVIKNIFLLSSLLSLIIGTVVGLAQIRIKRLLAYSTISHVGFLLLALAISTVQSTESLILYLIQYIITSLNTFFILLAFGYIINYSISSFSLSTSARPYLPIGPEIGRSSGSKGEAGLALPDIKFISDLKGQFLANPILSISLAICLFSMAGIPPLIGFFGKQSVLYAAIGNGYYFMALLAIIVSVISAYYYLRVIRELHSDTSSSLLVDTHNLASLVSFKKPGVIQERSRPYTIDSLDLKIAGLGEGSASLKLCNSLGSEMYQNSSLVLTNLHSFIIATLTLSILFFVLKPSIILNSTVLLSLSLFNG